MQSDCELVNAVLDGNKAAFEELVLRYETMVRAVCLHILNDRHLAADAAQDTFVSAFQKLGILRDAKMFVPWLLKIAKTRSLDILRNRQNELMGGMARREHSDRGHVNGDDHLFDDEKQILLAAVMRLPDGDKETIMLRYFDNHPVQDIANMTGKNVGTITKQLSRAHAKLKNILERSHRLQSPERK